MAKNIEIIPVFILQVLQLADPSPENRPQSYFRSGTVTRHPHEIFCVFNKFLNPQKWARILKSYLYSSCKYFSWPTRGQKIDPSIISGPAHSPGIHLQYFVCPKKF